ncbi:MAG: adenosylmethionine decarboxylase [Symbiobacteriaceae bacterium]|nr:MAG: S-adenosylmethionine decarboxylase proenzyme [Bacillota bacterium]
MRALGRHVLAEAYECDPAILDDVNLVESILVEAALAAGAEVRQVAFHKFAPQGVSGVVVISESHLTIHTWPELGYAAIDVFTCGDHVDPWEACHYIFEHLRAGRVAATETKRGILDADASHQLQQLQPVALRRDAAG